MREKLVETKTPKCQKLKYMNVAIAHCGPCGLATREVGSSWKAMEEGVGMGGGANHRSLSTTCRDWA